MIIPGELNFTIYQGASFDMLINATDSDGAVNFETTYTNARMKARITVGAVGDPLFSLTTEAGGLVMDGTDLTIIMSAEDTADLSFTTAVYDIELIDATQTPEIVDRWLKGTITLDPEVTRP